MLKMSFNSNDENIKDFLYGKENLFKILDIIEVDILPENIKFEIK